MPKVYRIERSGMGIYSSGLLTNPELELDYYCDEQTHPNPKKDSAEFRSIWEEKETSDQYQFYFGFKSIEQLKKWFYSKKDREYLVQNGVVVKEIYVPLSSTIFGKKQVAFNWHKSKKVRVLNSNEWVD